MSSEETIDFEYILIAAEKASNFLDDAEKALSEEYFLEFLHHFCSACTIKAAIYLDNIGCDPSISGFLEKIKEQSIYYFKSGAHDFDTESDEDMAETEGYERFY